MSDQPDKAKARPSGGGFRLFLWSVLVIVAVFAAAAGWYVRPRTRAFLTDGDTIRQSARSAPIRDVLWQPPVPLGEIINTTNEDYEPRISWDGMTMYFVRGRAGGDADIYQSKRTPSGWTAPQPLAFINTQHDELGPAPSADGRSLYFYSDRPGGSGGYDLWVLRFDEDGHTPLGAPANLGELVNSPYNDYGPALDPTGTTIYFASNRPPRGDDKQTDRDAWPATVREDPAHRTYDLYAAPITKGGHGLARPLDALNTAYNDGPAAFSPAGDFLYFSSDRPGGRGGFDLYRARRIAGVFNPPTNLGPPVNTTANELDPGLAQLGYSLYFSSDRRVQAAAGDADEAKDYNLYYSSSREVFRDAEVTRASINWAAVWNAAGPNLLLALLALLLLLLLFRMMRGVRGRRLSLLARCLLASLVAHILLMLLLNVWQVTSSVAGLLGGNKEKIRIAMISPVQGDAISAQVLGALTDVDAPAFASVSTERLESQRLPTDTPALDPSRTIEVQRTPVELAAETTIDPEIAEAKPVEQQAPAFSEPSIDHSDNAQTVVLATPSDSSKIVEQEPSPEQPPPAPTPTPARPVVNRPDQQQPQLIEMEPAASSIESLNVQDARKFVGEAPARESTPHIKPRPPTSFPIAPTAHPSINTQFDMPAAAHREAESESALPNVEARLVQSQRDESAIRLDEMTDQPLQIRTLPPGDAGPRIPDAPIVTDADTAWTDADAATPSIAPLLDSSATVPATGSIDLPTLEASPRLAESESSPLVEAERRRAARMAPSALEETDRNPGAFREVNPQPSNVELDDRSLALVEATDWKDADPPAPSPTEFTAPVYLESDPPPSQAPFLPTLEVASDSAADSAPGATHFDSLAFPTDLVPRSNIVDPPHVESARVALAPSRTPIPDAWDHTVLDPTDAVRDAVRSPREPSPTALMNLVAPTVDPGSLNLTLPVESIPPENPYVQRSQENRRALLDRLGGSPETEAAVAGALRWLADHQSADGRWDADGFDAECGECGGETKVKADVALTGLALLSFLGANHTPDRDGPYRENVRRGLDWLLDRQEADGDLRDGESLYSQGIATIALAEAAGMTGDPALLDPVERAADYIVRARNRSQGGWRYEPGQPGDTSVLGWQVMALKSARNVGVAVNPIAFSVARDWLERVSAGDQSGLYAYRPGNRPSLSMAAEGMFIQQLLGRSSEEPRMRESASLLDGALPAWESNQNSYYWYYGTLAAFQHQGALWSRWNPAIKRELLGHQNRKGKRAGSWDPKDRYSLLGGRVYQTALCTLMLEVYYRYLPMYGPEAPADAIGQIRGRITDATTKRPILGASVKLDLPDRDPQIASAGRAGDYTLFPPQMPDFFALSTWAPGYVPQSINVPSSRLEGNILQIDFDLTPADRAVIAIEAFPTVHHIGNNRWEGRINSQFQKEAAGVMYEATFEIAEDQLPPHFSGAAVALLAKGVQCPPRIWINGQRVDQGLHESPRDGSFGEYELDFDIDEMEQGVNTLRIRSTTCRGDLDDWEFVNVQIRLSP